MLFNEREIFKECIQSLGKLDGKVALVRDAARGMGKSYAVALTKQGADVVVNDICHDLRGVPNLLFTAKQLEVGVKEIKSLEVRTLEATADVSNESQVKRMIQKIISKFGKLHILVNNAGVCSSGSFIKPTTSEWDAVYNVGLTFLCSKYATPRIMKWDFGKIINITGAYGVEGGPPVVHYGTMEAGIITVTRTLAIELAPYNINANAVWPAIIYIEAYQYLLRKFYPDLNPRVTYERICKDSLLFRRETTCEDVPNAVVWLANEETRNILWEVIFLTADLEKTIAQVTGRVNIV